MKYTVHIVGNDSESVQITANNAEEASNLFINTTSPEKEGWALVWDEKGQSTQFPVTKKTHPNEDFKESTIRPKAIVPNPSYSATAIFLAVVAVLYLVYSIYSIAVIGFRNTIFHLVAVTFLIAAAKITACLHEGVKRLASIQQVTKINDEE